MNELNQRFDRVLSTPEGLNGAHASMSPGLAAQVLALLWDAYQADGDGYCGEDNPYGACGGGVDCDDSDPTKNPAGASCGGGGSCFAAGTPILMADGSPKAIESISVGDAVMSYDIAQDKIVFGVVTAAIAHKNETETMVVINGSLQATTDHPIYINGSWADAGTLKVGDTLSIRNPASAEVEAVPVHSVERLERRATVYDLEVAGVQNYFAAGILVHNKDLPVNHFSAMGGGTP